MQRLLGFYLFVLNECEIPADILKQQSKLDACAQQLYQHTCCKCHACRAKGKAASPFHGGFCSYKCQEAEVAREAGELHMIALVKEMTAEEAFKWFGYCYLELQWKFKHGGACKRRVDEFEKHRQEQWRIQTNRVGVCHLSMPRDGADSDPEATEFQVVVEGQTYLEPNSSGS